MNDVNPLVVDTPEVSAPDVCEELLTAADLCRAMKISSATFYRMVRDPKFPKPVYLGDATKRGRGKMTRWRRRDFEQWLKNNIFTNTEGTHES